MEERINIKICFKSSKTEAKARETSEKTCDEDELALRAFLKGLKDFSVSVHVQKVLKMTSHIALLLKFLFFSSMRWWR